MRRTFFKFVTVLLFPTIFISCSSKVDAKFREEFVVQASTRYTGATNSNEKITLTPYPKGKRHETSESIPADEDEIVAEESNEEPPVYPISDFLMTDKKNTAQSPAGPSMADDLLNAVPPVVDAASNTYLTEAPEVQEKPKEIESPVIREEPPVVEEKKQDDVPPPVVEEIVEESKDVVEDTLQSEEYKRSLGAISEANITKEVFEEDKTSILAIIEKLSLVMKNKDYKAWLKYLDENSIKYWSNKKNLQKAQSRLPVKGLYLRNLEDYFKYVFIPSRSGHKVDEIRYETESQVKAVQVNGDKDTVYYYFKKSVNGAWKLHLPPISD